jgi:hypothetical protein
MLLTSGSLAHSLKTLLSLAQIVVERLWFRLVSELCFESRVTPYTLLFEEWTALTEAYSGWSLTEIKSLSPRERKNWLDAAVFNKKLVRKSS